MAFKIMLLTLAAVLVQTITAQCIGNPALAGQGLTLGNNYLGASGLGLGVNGMGLGAAGPGVGVGGVGLGGLGVGYNGFNPAALSNGGGLIVTSSSPIAPTGISVLADNLLIEGPVSVGGQLPLLGTIALEGALPTGGLAGANYGCGNGNVGILNEIGANAGLSAAGSGLGVNGVGLGAAGPGVGVGGVGLGGLGVQGLGLGINGCGRIL